MLRFRESRVGVVLSLVAASFLLVFTSQATASVATYTGSDGSGRSASAIFDLSGSTLTVTLANTSPGDAPDATWILLAALFNTNSSLTPVSASLPTGTTVYGSFVNNVGEGWQYKSGVSAHGMNSGISGAGYGVFGPSGNFFSPGVMLDGSDYGIAPIGFTNTGNASIKDPIFQNSIVFTLNAPGFSLSELGNTIVFQYGTSLSEPSFNGTLQGSTPEPASLMLFGSGVLGLTGLLRRKLKS
jgi:hypothetical protein